MGDNRRFQVFADFVANQIPKNDRRDIRIADVAGGRGRLQAALQEKGFRNIITIDPRRTARPPKCYAQKCKPFLPEEAKNFDLLLGMHPDEATDAIIIGGARHKVPFILVPCCVKTSVTTYWGKNNIHSWIKYLKHLALINQAEIQETLIKISGRNQVLYWKGN